MATRIAVLKRTAFAAALAALAAGAVGAAPARAADDCLASPNAQAPKGSHWHYRVDHATHRKCWYIAQPGQKAHEAAAKPHEPARTRAPAAPQNAAEAPAPAQAAQAPATGAGDQTPQGNPQGTAENAAPPAAPPATTAGNQGAPAPGTFALPSTASAPDQPATAAATPATGAAGGDAATQPPAAAEPSTTGSTDQDSAPPPAPKTTAATPPQSGAMGWTVLKIAAAVLTLGVLMFVAFKAPVRRPPRLARDPRPDWDLRGAEEHASPTLVPQDQSGLPHMATEDVTTAPRTDPGRGRREALQAPEQAAPEGGRA